MRGWVLGVVLAAGAAQAQSPDWAVVGRLKPKDTVIVESGGTYVRCRLAAIEAATLACKEDGWRKPRLVFPAGQVQSVYHVHLKTSTIVKKSLEAAPLVCILVGVLAQSAPVFVIGLFTAGVLGWSLAADDALHWLEGPLPPSAFRSDERQDLIYARAASN